MKDYLRYGDKIEKINNKKKLQFIFLLLIRQKNVYDLVAKGKKWDCRKEINSIFEKCYKNIVDDEELSKDILDDIEDINPESIGWDNEEEIMGYMITFINNIEVFIKQLMDKSSIDICFAQCNYDYLESFIYEYNGWKGDNTNVLLEEELMKQEIERGIRDLKILVHTSDSDFDQILHNNELLIDKKYLEEYL